MADATFVAQGEFTGDGSGNAIAFTNGSNGWGTVAPSGNSLAATGKASTDNSTPGIYVAEGFSGSSLSTTISNPFMPTAAGANFALVETWRWTGSRFTVSGSNAFVSTLISKPANSNQTMTTCPTSEPNGTYEADLVGSGAQTAMNVVPIAISPSFGGTTICTIQVPGSVPVDAEATTASGADIWLTVPAWMLSNLNLSQSPLGSMSIDPSQVAAGSSPLVAPMLANGTFVSNFGSAPAGGGTSLALGQLVISNHQVVRIEMVGNTPNE